MGFLDSLDRGIDDFLDFSPSAYRREIETLEELQLRERHKQIQRKITGAGAQIAAGGAGALATGGFSLVFSGIGARRAKVNSQKCDIIEARLRQKGWTGHDFGFKDALVGLGPSAVASVLAPGADHLASHLFNHAATTTASHGVAHATTTTATTTAATVHHGAAHAVTTAVTNHALHDGSKQAIKQGTRIALETWADKCSEIAPSQPSFQDSPEPREKTSYTAPFSSFPEHVRAIMQQDGISQESQEKMSDTAPFRAFPKPVREVLDQDDISLEQRASSCARRPRLPTPSGPKSILKIQRQQANNTPPELQMNWMTSTYHKTLSQIVLTMANLIICPISERETFYWLTFGIAMWSAWHGDRRAAFAYASFAWMLWWGEFPVFWLASVTRLLALVVVGAWRHGWVFAAVLFLPVCLIPCVLLTYIPE